MVNNLEFNVELKDSADVKFALDRFEELWKDGIPIQDAYIEAAFMSQGSSPVTNEHNERITFPISSGLR